MGRKKEEIQVFYSDDYAGCENKRHHFYFGYERTLCQVHGKDRPCECEETEWCFTVMVDGVEVKRITRSQLEELTDYASPELSNPPDYLLAGIMIWLRDLSGDSPTSDKDKEKK